MAYFETESPSQRAGHQIQLLLSHVFAFVDENHRFSKLVSMADLKRRFVRSPYDSPWKVMETRERRQTWMWREIWENPWRLTQTRRAWNDFKGEPVTEAQVEETIAHAKAAVETIRARGGEVVFLRPPSSDPVLANEIVRHPRERVWDRLVHETGTVGLHFADDPSLAAMDLPEYSHLSPPCARHYTFAYASKLRELVPRLATRPVALEPLRPTEACVRREYAAVPRAPFPELPPPPPKPPAPPKP
jgi:hypothetical protein